jgi:hypothetical protein
MLNIEHGTSVASACVKNAFLRRSSLSFAFHLREICERSQTLGNLISAVLPRLYKGE